MGSQTAATVDGSSHGIARCAWVLAHAVDAYAVAGGEGSRRLADALAAVATGLTGNKHGGPPTALLGEGIDAARAALGAAAAGQRVALLASGDALAEVVPVVREMARLGLPVVLAVASHGDEGGGVLPGPGPADLAAVLDGPAGVFLAGDVDQVTDLTLAALRAASDRSRPWVVGFDLGAMGLRETRTEQPSPAAIRGWMSASRAPEPSPEGTTTGEAAMVHLRAVERYDFAARAALREMERTSGRRCGPCLHDGPRDADVVLVSAGASAHGARELARAVTGNREGNGLRVAAVQVVSLRPLPVADLVRWTWRARVVVVHEAFPEGVGTGGRLSDALRAAFADALTWHPSHTGIGRVPPVVTLHAEGTVGGAQWAQAVRGVDTREPPRWLSAGPDGQGPRSGMGDV